jgi:hypothetical protein
VTSAVDPQAPRVPHFTKNKRHVSAGRANQNHEALPPDSGERRHVE